MPDTLKTKLLQTTVDIFRSFGYNVDTSKINL
jgi:hypothetical protein